MDHHPYDRSVRRKDQLLIVAWWLYFTTIFVNTCSEKYTFINEERGFISICSAAAFTHTRDNNVGNGTSVGEQVFNYELVTVTLFE